MADPAQGGEQAPRPSGKSQRKVKNFILDLRYQMKFTLTMVAIAGALTTALGYVIMSKAHEASRVVEVRAMDPDDAIAAELVQQFAANDRMLIWLLVGFGLLLSVVLTVYGIVITHKVAGPLFKVSLYLDKIRDGKLGQVYNLRKGDELVEFFEHFKAAHEALRKQEQGDVELLQRIVDKVNDDALKTEINDVIAKKIESLK
jgi:hypothetical protein